METTENLQKLQFNIKTPLEIKEELNFKHITKEDGLHENSVFTIIQDKSGFLWLATQTGIVKYDGYKMKVYRTSPDTGLSGYIPRVLLEDENNILWIGTESGGLNKFDLSNETFKHYRFLHNNSNCLSNDYIIAISKDGSGYLWIGTMGGGFNKFDPGREIFTHYRHDPENINSPSSDRMTSFLIDRKGIFWIGTSKDGLDKFDSEKKTFKHFRHQKENLNSINCENINVVFEDKDGFLWIGTERGLERFDKDKEIFTHYKFDSAENASETDNIVSIFEDKHGFLWISTYGQGLIRFDKKKEVFTRCKYGPDNNSSLSSNFATVTYQDLSGIIWVGTWRGGLNKYDSQTVQFKLNRNKNSPSPNVHNGRCVIADKEGTIWIGTDCGLQKYDIEKGIFHEFKNEPGNSSSLSNNLVSSLYEDSNGNLWVGTKEGLNKFNKEKESFIHFKNEPIIPNSISHNGVTCIGEDHSGILWVGTNNGLNKFDSKTGTFKVYKNIPGDSLSLSYNIIFKLYTDKQGTFWIGTSNAGLNKFEPKNEIFRHYWYPDIGFTGMLTLFEDTKERFWVGTFYSGLCLFDRTSGKVKSFNTRHGLDSEIVKNILEDNNGKLWLSTDIGISCFDPETNTFTNYNKGDGIGVTEVYRNSSCVLKNGTMLFGGKEGIMWFSPDSIKNNKYIPKIVLTDIKIFDKSIRAYTNSPINKHISLADEVKLTYRESIFSFEFAALDYSVPEKNKYAYKMEGFDKDWRYTDASNRIAAYTNLNPGEYTFRVKGSNNDGAWNEKGASIKVIITPPYWKTWWFRVLAGAAATGIFGSSVRYVTIQRFKRRLELEKERSRISKDMHDEVGTSLTKIAILSQIAKQKVNDPQIMEEVEKISESAGEIVDNISEIIWAINPKNDTLDNLLAYIREYASETLELKSIDYDIVLPDNIPAIHLSAELRRNIFLVIKESLNNILKYANASKTELIVKLKNSILEIRIRDNGKGFDINNTRKFGNGLINMRKRIKDIKGELKIDSAEGKGTVIDISVKLDK